MQELEPLTSDYAQFAGARALTAGCALRCLCPVAVGGRGGLITWRILRRRFASSASWYRSSWSLRFVASIFFSTATLQATTGGIFFGCAGTGTTAGAPMLADDGFTQLVLTTGALFLGNGP